MKLSSFVNRLINEIFFQNAVVSYNSSPFYKVKLVRIQK